MRKDKKKITFNNLVDTEIYEYKQRTDIYEDKKKVQIIYLDLTTDDFYKAYSTESLLKPEVYSFIEDTYDIFVTNEKKFKLEIEYPKDMDIEERLKIETLIAVHYAIECDEIRYDIKREFMIGSFLLLLGIIIMIISYIVRQYTSLVGEIIQIISWAFIWESALRFFLQNTANYRERIKYKELYRMARLKRNETLNQKK
jgi:hypothetical protein